MRTPIVQKVRTHNQHGMRFMFGNRMAEALRCYAGQWAVFRYVADKMVRDGSRETITYGKAIAAARAFVVAQEGGA